MPSDETTRPPVDEVPPDSPNEIEPQTETVMRGYRGAGRLADRMAVVSGGDAGLGRAVAVAFAREGADVAITYLDAHEDAQETMRLIAEIGGQTMAISGDVGNSGFCADAVSEIVKKFGRIDVLVTNAAMAPDAGDFAEISDARIEHVFRSNVFGQFFLVRAALPHMASGGAIVNTTSVTAYRGSAARIDAAAAMGAIVSFTRSLAPALADRGIRVNAVAPGDEAMPPHDAASSYVFLASDDASAMTGQVLHPHGGAIVSD